MEINPILEIIIEVLLFLAASYLIFYKSWVKALGKEVAKLSTASELTKLKEEVKEEFNQNLESYKKELSEELALSVEPLKSELNKANITHQIEFGYLHQERSKVVLELYKKLQILHGSMVQWTARLHPVVEDAEKESKERTKQVNKAINDFQNYYATNKLFFSKSFCQFIDEVFKEYWDKGWEFGYSKERVEKGELTEEYFKHYTKEMNKISDEVRENLPKKIDEIEERFRKILRVEEDENNSE